MWEAFLSYELGGGEWSVSFDNFTSNYRIKHCIREVIGSNPGHDSDYSD
jgi:hypothetical protein